MLIIHIIFMGCVQTAPATAAMGRDGNRLHCDQGHPMKYLRVGKAARDCSRCRNPIRGNDYLCCEVCNYNACAQCAKRQ
jgi:hypothetical protein